jgi:hypothetical protein
MAQLLGPLELVGDRWVVGDPTRKAGLCVVLTPEGLEYHRRGETAPQLAIQWSQCVELKVQAAYRSWHTTPGLGVVAGDMGRDGCSLHGILRHPHELELWKVRYTHHQRHYKAGHVIVLKALFDQLTEAKALGRLGDPEWLGAAVTKLSAYTSWYAPKGNRLVEETIQSLGT